MLIDHHVCCVIRWAVGAIQILQGQNPLFTRGLHWRARWLYFVSTVGPLYVVPVMGMLLVMYGTILSNARVSFGPRSFTEYAMIGAPCAGGEHFTVLYYTVLHCTVLCVYLHNHILVITVEC